MEKYIKIKCPSCGSILIIDKIDEKIVEVRKPLIEKSTGDRFKDAFLKYQSSKNETEKKFEQLKQEEKHKKDKLDDLFKKSINKVKKSGKIEKEIRDIDLD